MKSDDNGHMPMLTSTFKAAQANDITTDLHKLLLSNMSSYPNLSLWDSSIQVLRSSHSGPVNAVLDGSL